MGQRPGEGGVHGEPLTGNGRNWSGPDASNHPRGKGRIVISNALDWHGVPEFRCEFLFSEKEKMMGRILRRKVRRIGRAHKVRLASSMFNVGKVERVIMNGRDARAEKGGKDREGFSWR